MPTPFTTSLREAPEGGRVLVLTGEIDMSNVERFRSALEATLRGTASATIDLTKVEYLDSSGLTSLFGCTADNELRIVASSLLARVLRVSGLTEVATVTIVD
ncbi:STAS domain-containing protein [Amycolatopsis acidiphila]|uniref:STAS domain-containing protein n=1 Tax=Amycolatopsis acidiphila TaxID=715473 RepID=A0A558ADD3_9PSEU|nr:STAS domain-containing protein [Amycolatopsis acidiphila]TVT22272.1 STAS domain-containing protein [Amycolatopsis acidiphila]UIJ58013.1 STAS domain-containing protein [Amycolatopsis acidiphila]GHG70572.1 anti-anti-sigma factor [Amycolatopsis acidiphila]